MRTFKLGYCVIVLCLLAMMTIGTLSSSFYILRTTRCLPNYFHLIYILGIILYVAICVVYVRSKRNFLWGALLLYLGAAACCAVIILTVNHLKSQAIDFVNVKKPIACSQFEQKIKYIEKKTGRKVVISHKEQGLIFYFKRSSNAKENEEIASYIEKSFMKSSQ